MICSYHKKNISHAEIDKHYSLGREGVSLYNLSTAAENLGFRTIAVKTDINTFKKKFNAPVIVSWNNNHYVIVYKIRNNTFYIADPALGKIKYEQEQFEKSWTINEKSPSFGLVLYLDPLPEFDNNTKTKNKASFFFIVKYFQKYSSYLIQLFWGLLLGGALQISLPFLTQLTIDYGIGYKNLNIIFIIALGQLFLYVSVLLSEFLRSWMLIHISSRVNTFIISDYLMKLMELPLSFFDRRLKADLLQRIRDHQRIEAFMTETVSKSIFSIISVIALSLALLIYSSIIFNIFLFSTLFELWWIYRYLAKVRIYDNQSFKLMSLDQAKLIEIIDGIQEIKLYNTEKQKRWEWERVQASLLEVNIKKLAIMQSQDGVGRLIHNLQLVLINMIAAYLVVIGTLSLGEMLAVIFIIGQLSSPITQIINLFISGNTAKISLERIGEIYEKKSEENIDLHNDIIDLKAKDISLKNVVMYFDENQYKDVLKNINITIPPGKITAIVGESGSGKTTLLKLLFKIYVPKQGDIIIGDKNFHSVNPIVWRQLCGSVLQDSYIFSDSIEANISLGAEQIDYEKLSRAAKIANINHFVNELPKGFDTRIGDNGIKLSQGQKQRILIARAVYREPDYLFLDESTNSLDANNESTILCNLQEFYKGRTIVIVAHRLSTIMNAEQIILLDNGKIVESGNHNSLILEKGYYYRLFKNQMPDFQV